MLKPEGLEAWEKPWRQEANACLRGRREISPSLPLSPHCFSFPLLLLPPPFPLPVKMVAHTGGSVQVVKQEEGSKGSFPS